jgi:pilus assembly protein CpaC
MRNRTMLRVAAFPHALAADTRAGSTITVIAADSTSRFVSLGIGKSAAIELPDDVKDVLVADPKTANAVVRSSRRAYIIGVGVGQTNIFFFDAQGRQIAGFDIAVTRDLNGIRAAIKHATPDSDIRVDGVGPDGIVLSGSAANAGDAQQAFDIASRLVPDGKVVNGIVVRDRDQVMLKVSVAEIQRNLIKQLGVDLNGSLGYGTHVVNFNTSNPFSANGSALTDTKLSGSPINGVTATLRAMDRAGLIRTLAEPNLTAISGETATFMAGGEFPIPSGLQCDTTRSPPVCQPQIAFKKFGVSLMFTPIVMSAGRISLKVQTEVSELSNENAMTLSPPSSSSATFSSTGLTVPSIRTRRADTVVEVPSGGTLAMAGMIQQQTKQQINGIPGLMQLPVLGALFKSRDYINNQTELVVLVTPYIVKAVAQKNLSRPDDGYADPSDQSTILLGRLNRIYGAPGVAEARPVYRGSYGFNLD